jgi:hypothetical protein
MTTVEALRDWFLSCPYLDEGKRFGVDYNGEKAGQYAIYITSSAIDSFEDILGNVFEEPRQRLEFVFADLCTYGAEVLQNMQNLGFFDNLMRWMIDQNDTKNFPKIEEGRVIKVLPITTQYLAAATPNTGQYQIQCQLTYWRD